MSKHKAMSRPRFIQQRTRGQSIPLIALMIVVLVAMVGLSVDVGNTFSEERQAVSASNAASISAMSTYIRRDAATTNESVYNTIVETLKSNGVDVSTGSPIQMEAFYLDEQGNQMPSGQITANGSKTPDNVSYIQVKLNGTVDTYFARVVNRPTLPINATAYAGTCPPSQGVYPIGISEDYLNGWKFKSDNTFYEDITSGSYRGYTKSRLYVRDTNAPGAFGYLRWRETEKGGNSAVALAASLKGPGNLGAGFDEVNPWPSDSLPEPDNYPEKPNQINVGDWVHGSTGWKNSNDVRDAIAAHMGKTWMILPIYDVVLEQGSNAAFRVTRFGLFVIVDRGQQDANKKGPWFDFIFLGPADMLNNACSVTPPNTQIPPTDLVGTVTFDPQRADRPKVHQPVQYVIVLDTSGSMNMNFIGQGVRNGQITQCTNGPVGAPANQNCGTPDNAWPNVNERRIKVAKDALELLISQTNMPGNPGYNTALPNDQIALVWFDGSSSTSDTRPFSNDPVALASNVRSAGNYKGDPYKSEGGTNGAAGLYRASQLLQSAPKTTNELGKQWTYKPVVIFLTDGVSNNFLNTNAANLNGGASNEGTYTKQNSCSSLGAKVVENAACQTTELGGKHKGMDRPITQMMNVANDQIKNNAGARNAEIYVLALSNIEDTGLKTGVAQTPQHFFAIPTIDASKQDNEVDLAMKAINKKVEGNQCTVLGDTNVGIIQSNEFAPVTTDSFSLAYPNVGVIFLVNPTTNATYQTYIVARNGVMEYKFENMPRGTYQLSGGLYYRYPGDTKARPYDNIYGQGTNTTAISVVLEPNSSSGGFTTTIRQDLRLQLSINENVCAAP